MLIILSLNGFTKMFFGDFDSSTQGLFSQRERYYLCACTRYGRRLLSVLLTKYTHTKIQYLKKNYGRQNLLPPFNAKCLNNFSFSSTSLIICGCTRYGERLHTQRPIDQVQTDKEIHISTVFHARLADTWPSDYYPFPWSMCRFGGLVLKYLLSQNASLVDRHRFQYSFTIEATYWYSECLDQSVI